MTWVPHGTDGRIAKANAAQVADINGAVAHPYPPMRVRCHHYADDNYKNKNKE